VSSPSWETFLGQPYKTYSTGMMARLVFAVADVAGQRSHRRRNARAGDAYFFSKSMERMKRLVLGGGGLRPAGVALARPHPSIL